MEDALDPYYLEVNCMGENMHTRNEELKSNGCINQERSPKIEKTMRRVRIELESYNVDIQRLIKYQEE